MAGHGPTDSEATDQGARQMKLGSLAAIGAPFEMPKPGDPDPIISVHGDDHLVISCGDQSIGLSAYNAARVVAGLALFLNIKISPATARKLML